MNDKLRLAVMLVVTNGFNLVVGFGVGLTHEQIAMAGSFVDSVLLLVMFFWKSGQEPGNGN